MSTRSPFIVAEMSASHLGSIQRALRIIEAAAEAGADAIKFQTWAPDTMCVDASYTLDSGPWKGRRLMDLYREAWTPWGWHRPMFHHAREHGLIPFSAAFDCESVDLLETLGVDRHKVASFELVDLPLIRYMASKGKPMILSTGMATYAEGSAAYRAARAAFPVRDALPPILLLKCTSAYPADASEANLWTHAESRATHWGLSDHTQGIGVAVAAAALGAEYIEKHLTLSRADGGPDAGFSMEPHEFKQMVVECRRAAAAVGTVHYGPTAGESTHLRRSLWVVKPILAGEPLRLGDNVRTARPALGLPPSFDLDSKRARTSIAAGSPLTADDVE